VGNGERARAFAADCATSAARRIPAGRTRRRSTGCAAPGAVSARARGCPAATAVAVFEAQAALLTDYLIGAARL
jgi:hypothetical protein